MDWKNIQEKMEAINYYELLLLHAQKEKGELNIADYINRLSKNLTILKDINHQLSTNRVFLTPEGKRVPER